MKKLLPILLCAIATPALAQNPTCPNRANGDSTNACANTRFVQNAIAGVVTPPLVLNHILIGNASNLAVDAPMTGDCSISFSAGNAAIVCTKTNGTNFSPLATATGTGIPAQTGSTINFRTLTGTAGEITVTNGNGGAGNPTFSIPTPLVMTAKSVTGGTFNGPAIVGGTVDNTSIGATTRSSVRGTTADFNGAAVFSGAFTASSTITLSGLSGAGTECVAVSAVGATSRVPCSGGGGLPPGGTVGQLLYKYDSTNDHANWYMPPEMNLGVDPNTTCSGASASDTAFSDAFTNFDNVLIPDGCIIKLSTQYTIPKGKVLTIASGGSLSLDAKTTAVSGAVTCPATCVTGNIRLTVASTAYLATGMRVTVAAVGGTTEANGNWIISVVDGTHIDLIGTTFVNAYTAGGTVTVCNLFFKGTVRAPPVQVISGAGMTCGIAEVMPEWWGALNDGATSDIAALRAAWNSVASATGSDGNPTIRLASGGTCYAVDDQWTIAPSFNVPLQIVGGGSSRSRICAKAGFSATSVMQVNGNYADGVSEVVNFKFSGFGITQLAGTTGLSVRGITFGSVGQQIQSATYAYVSDLVVDGFLLGMMVANTRLVEWDRVSVYSPRLNNSICLQFDQFDTTHFTADLRWKNFQCRPWNNAAHGITGQKGIYFRTSTGTTGIAAVYFDNATIYPPYNANSVHVDTLCDGANVTDIKFWGPQLEGGISSGLAGSFLVRNSGTGVCYGFGLHSGYMQGLGGDGIILNSATADDIFDVVITDFPIIRGIVGTPIVALNTNNVTIANNAFRDNNTAAQYIFLSAAFGTSVTGNVANSAAATTAFINGNSSSMNTGCVNNRTISAAPTFSVNMGAGFNDCTGGGSNANRP